MKHAWGIFIFILCTYPLLGQDTTKSQIEINGYVDTYFGYDKNQPISGNRPYAVSSAKHNEFAINLAYIDFAYTSQRVRARFTPGFGTYMNTNYAAEQGSMRNVVEASAGVKLSAKKDIWVDAGVIGSPFGYENAISKSQLLYTRSMAAEFSPYYFAGVKLSLPLVKKLTANLYAVNGWQQIADVNKGKSAILNLEYKPGKWVINASAYYGSEENLGSINLRNRIFFDGHATYSYKRVKASAGASYGIQKIKNLDDARWYQFNLAGQYNITHKIIVSARVETFADEDGIVAAPITAASSFVCYSYALGGSYAVTPNAVFRLEARAYKATGKVFLDTEQLPTDNTVMGIASLTINFGHLFDVPAPSKSTNTQ